MPWTAEMMTSQKHTEAVAFLQALSGLSTFASAGTPLSALSTWELLGLLEEAAQGTSKSTSWPLFSPLAWLRGLLGCECSGQLG